MPTNKYFTQGVPSEQRLYEDIVIESIQFYGQDIYYLPRNIIQLDNILNEDIESTFDKSYVIEMYPENTDSFEGEGDLFAKFGVEIRDQATFVVSKRRWNKLTNEATNGIDQVRPNEGDLIYLPMSKSFFEIKFVEHESPFYQLKNLPLYRLQCELFEYRGENFETSIEEIDDVIAKFETIPDPQKRNTVFENEGDAIIDFDEKNPFGEPD